MTEEKLTIKQKLELKKLKDHNVSYFEVQYSGGGDDGCLDEVEFFDVNGKPIKTLDEGKFMSEMDDYIYELIGNQVHYDWINNEGGFGVLIMNLEDNTVNIEHNQRYTEYHPYNSETSKKLEIFSKELKYGSPIIA